MQGPDGLYKAREPEIQSWFGPASCPPPPMSVEHVREEHIQQGHFVLFEELGCQAWFPYAVGQITAVPAWDTADGQDLAIPVELYSLDGQALNCTQTCSSSACPAHAWYMRHLMHSMQRRGCTLATHQIKSASAGGSCLVTIAGAKCEVASPHIATTWQTCCSCIQGTPLTAV